MTFSASGARVLVIVKAHRSPSETQAMASLFAAAGLPVSVVCNAWSEDSSTAERIEGILGQAVHRIDLGWRPEGSENPIERHAESASKSIAALPRLVSLARSTRAEVIYTSQQAADCSLGWAVAMATRRPQVVHLHYPLGPWLGRLAKSRLLRCRRVITVSEFLRKQLLALGRKPEDVVSVHNPQMAVASHGAVVAASDLQIAEGTLVAGIVARVEPWKGQADSIRAFATRRSKRPAVLLVVGDGPDRARVERLAAELGVGESVRFLGWRADVPSLLARMDLFLHPSFDEAFGLAVLEAQAAGLPVLAFDEGGIPEIVAQGSSGILVPSRSVPLLRDALDRLLDDDQLRADMSQRARERARLFSADRLGPQFARAFEFEG